MYPALNPDEKFLWTNLHFAEAYIQYHESYEFGEIIVEFPLLSGGVYTVPAGYMQGFN